MQDCPLQVLTQLFAEDLPVKDEADSAEQSRLAFQELKTQEYLIQAVSGLQL